MMEEEGFMAYTTRGQSRRYDTAFWELSGRPSLLQSPCAGHMTTKTNKPFGQEVQKVQVLLALLEVPEKYKQTIIQGSHR